MLLIALLVSVGIATAGVGAQARPDFSGRWVLVGSSGDPEDLAQTLAVHLATVDTEASGLPVGLTTLSVSREIDGVNRTEILKVGLDGGVIGGVSASAPRPETRTFWSVRWIDACLVSYSEISSGTVGVDPDARRTTTEQWCMNAAQQLVVAIRRTQSGQAARSATRVYRRP